MHFVKVEVDEAKLADVLNSLDTEDLIKFRKIPRITDADGVWVSASHKEVIESLIGDAITGWSSFDYKDNSRVKFGKGMTGAVPILLELVREVAVLLDYEKVYVVNKELYEELSPTERQNQRNLFLLLNSAPENMRGRRQGRSAMRFGQVKVKVPTAIKLSFTQIKETAQHAETVIKDDDNLPIAVYQGNRIWIPFDIVAIRGGFDMEWYPTLVAREILARCLASAASKSGTQTTDERSKILEGCRKDFVKHCRSDVDRQKQEIEDRLAKARAEVVRLEKAIDETYQQARLDNELLIGLSRTDARDKQLNEQFDLMKDHIPLLRSLSFSRDGLTFETEMIYIESDGNTKNPKKFDPFPVGRFSVKLERGKAPYVVNLSHRLSYSAMGSNSLWDHPHVQDHWPCLGNIQSKMAKLISEDKWFGAISYMIESLKNIQSDDVWAMKGLPKFQAAAPNLIQSQMDEDKKDAIKNWVSYKHRMPLGLIAEVGDEVRATCPDTCPMKDGKCKFQGDGVRDAIIENLYDDRVEVKWQEKEEDGGREFRCPGFTYESVKFRDGRNIIQAFVEIKPGQLGRNVVPARRAPAPQLPNEIAGFKIVREDDKNQWVAHNEEYDTKVLITDQTLEAVGIDEVENLLRLAIGAPPEALEQGQDGANLYDDTLERMQRMTREQREDMPIATINLQTEDTPVTQPDDVWTDPEETTPEDDDILEAFSEGLDLGQDF